MSDLRWECPPERLANGRVIYRCNYGHFHSYAGAAWSCDGPRQKANEPTCTPDGCTYPMVVGLIPGVDVSIDGDVWSGSPYADHIDVCPANGREANR